LINEVQPGSFSPLTRDQQSCLARADYDDLAIYSGSPTLNLKGELVGLLFDGTDESVASNFLFDPVTPGLFMWIAVTMRWNMAEVDGAVNLLEEMSLAPQVSARATSPLKPAAAVSAEPARR
jgi:hypothetical protein